MSYGLNWFYLPKTSVSGTAAGNTGVTLIGNSLTDTTGITFNGIPATYVKVANSTTVNAVAPTHAAAIVDVTITTSHGSATLTNGYS